MQRIIFHILFLGSLCVKAQVSASLFIDANPEKTQVFGDTLALQKFIENRTLRLINQGYYFAGLDSIIQSGQEQKIYLHRGRKLRLEIQNIRKKNVVNNLEKRLGYLSDHGYPFSSIKIDSSRSESGRLIGIVKESKGPLITNDSAYFVNAIKTNHSYVYQLIDFIPGKPFSEKNYSLVQNKIDRSPFLTLRKNPDVSFQNTSAKLYLEIDETPASTFQGILGLQQQRQSSNLVGNINLNIKNLFRSGKELDLEWERFSENSQQLILAYTHPFFLNSKLNPVFELELLRQDSTFLTRNFGLSVGTYFSPKVEFVVGFESVNGTLLSTDEQLIAGSNLADFGSDVYKAKLIKDGFDKFNQLNSENAFELSIGVGKKEIEQNLSLPSSFYDSLALKTDILVGKLHLGKQFKILKRQSVFQYIGAGVIDNDELLDNERFRLGGLSTLRGFNEKFIFADRYLLSRTEFRSFFENSSFLYVFFDQLWYRNGSRSDTPFGTGLGFSLATLSGQFSLALAVGKSLEQQLDFANMKIHFGYITKF